MFREYYNKKEYKVGGFRKKAILGFINTGTNPLILDIGCGDGRLGYVIKKSIQANIHGVDISKISIIKAKKILDQAMQLDVTFDKKQVWPKEILKNKYDFIIISEVLEHLFFPEDLLQKITDISHSKTEIIITVPNILFWKNRLKIVFGHFTYTEQGIMDRGHIHFFSYSALKKMIYNLKYSIISENHHMPTRVFKPIARLCPGLFAYQFIIKIKKNEN